MKGGFNRQAAIVIAACIAISFVLGYAGGWAYNIYFEHKCPNFSSTAEIYVYPDMPADSVMAQISEKAGVLKPKRLAHVLKTKTFTGFKPGHYTIDPSNTSVYVVRMLCNGWQTPVNMVLSGSMRRLSDIARKIGKQMLVDSASVMSALTDTAELAKYGFDPSDVFAMFIPDTYQMYWTDSVTTILDRQKANYDAFWSAENIAKAEKQGLTPMQVSIVASIVKGESNYVPEYGNIAGVYLNRYRKGMKLQADPTVAFCYDYKLNRILKKHLLYDSPYNTYKYAGLPPAPICVAPKEALEAVLNAPEHNYLYFCASPELNGTHRFASSYSEHLRNARDFYQAIRNRDKAK